MAQPKDDFNDSLLAKICSNPYFIAIPALFLDCLWLWLAFVLPPLFFPPLLAWAIWAYFFDEPASHSGRSWLQPGLRKAWNAKLAVARLGVHTMIDPRAEQAWRAYEKDVAEPDRRVLFSSYPHGAVGTASAMSMLISDQLADLMPWLLSFEPGKEFCRFRAVGTYLHFLTPFLRELSFAAGAFNATEESLESWLTGGAAAKEPRGIMVVSGGSREQKYVGSNRIILNRRKGMVRIAMKTGAALVPCWAFGETYLFPPPPHGPIWDKIHAFTDKYFITTISKGFPPVFWPKRPPHGIHFVIGPPLRVPQMAEPTNEEIDKWHAKYVEETRKLFDRFKDEFDPDRETELEIVE